MASGNIVWSRMAVKDASTIIKYWDDHNSSTRYGDKLIVSIEQIISAVAAMPFAGVRTDIPDVRYRLVDEQFMLIYRTLPGTISILRFWDTRRDIKKLKRYFK